MEIIPTLGTIVVIMFIVGLVVALGKIILKIQEREIERLSQEIEEKKRRNKEYLINSISTSVRDIRYRKEKNRA